MYTRRQRQYAQYKERLGYSEQWMTEYVYNVVMLAKKEPKQKANEEK